MSDPSGSNNNSLRLFSDFWAYLKPRLLSFNIGHLLLILLGLHVFAMCFPNADGATIFDESYYVGSSHFDQDLLNLVPSNLEHPFFGKIWGALGIYLFGDNFFGWRIFYVLIGVLTVWVFYELARVFFSKDKALFAASLLGFETLFFIHTTAALLEGPPLLFGLLGVLLYFKKRYYLCALAFGLSILSKEWGLYFLIALALYVLYQETVGPPVRSVPVYVSAPGSNVRSKAARLDFRPLAKLLLFIFIVILVVTLPLWAYDAAYKPSGFTNPLDNFAYYYNYHTSLTLGPYNPNAPSCGANSTNPAQECDPWHYAWFWLDPLTVHPDAYYVVTVNFFNVLPNGTKVPTMTTYPEDWLGIGNLVIWYSFWAIVPYLIIKPIVTKKLSELEVLVGAWIIATYGPSLYLSAIVHRVVYAFYFVNVDPALALGIPMLISFITPEEKNAQRILMALWLGAALVFFILFFPVHPGPGL